MGKGLVYRCTIPAAEVKSGVDLDGALPPESAALTDRYIKHARPLLLESTEGWLSPRRKGPKVTCSYILRLCAETPSAVAIPGWVT